MKGSARFRMLFAISWLALTLSLGVWWWILGLRQAKTIADISASNQSHFELERVNRMLKLEGSFFLFMLGVGGVTLTTFSYRDYRRAKLITDFFSTVTHEMRTPLASLQLQVEGLIEDYPNLPITDKFKKLLIENRRIESRMGKAFYLASLMQGEKLFLETFPCLELFRNLKENYPALVFDPSCYDSISILGDKSALESILQNLLENSIRHGQATKIQVSIAKQKNSYLEMRIQDNGKGFEGDLQNLMKPFIRHTRTSGTGIGLFISKKLLEKMNGRISLRNNETGFLAILSVKLA